MAAITPAELAALLAGDARQHLSYALDICDELIAAGREPEALELLQRRILPVLEAQATAAARTARQRGPAA